MATKRKYPGQWRETHKELTGEFYISRMRGQLRIIPVYQRHLRRTTDRYGNVETMHETFKGYDIMYVLNKARMPEKVENLLALTDGAIDLFERLVRLHDNRVWRAEEAEKARRKKEYAEKKKIWDERKTHSSLRQRVLDKKFTRVVEP